MTLPACIDELETQAEGRKDDVLRSCEGKSDSPPGLIFLHLEVGNKNIRCQIAGEGGGRSGEGDGSVFQKIALRSNAGLMKLGFIQGGRRLYSGSTQ